MARWTAPLAGLLLVLSVAVHATLAAGPQTDDWTVSSIARTVELGTVASLSDVHVIRPPPGTAEPTKEDEVKPYYFTLFGHEAKHVSGLEATARYGPGVLPRQRAVLRVAEQGPMELPGSWAEANATVTRPHLYYIKLPLHFLQPAQGEEAVPDLTITVTGMLTHASVPLPKSVSQTESQYLLWKGSAAPITPYGAGSGRVRVKSPSPSILSYATEPPVSADQTIKSGSTITFGPYDKLASLLHDGQAALPSEARVHYLHNSPMLTIVEARRQARISHWRNRLEIEDQFWLRNDGASLKGHFSRVQHQLSTLVQRVKSHVLTNIVMQLPPGADHAYFIDESGNVSTSHFRPAPPSPSHVATPAHLLSEMRASVLDLRPRYPMLGGWNYTCSVGWSVKLTDGWLKTVDEGQKRYSVQVPFMSALKDTAVDDVAVRIILPEGAKDIAFTAPFSIDVERERSWSFLDTIGKPVIKLHKRACSERHGGSVNVEYTLTTGDLYRKGFVALLAGVLISGIIRLMGKVDLKIKA